MLNSNAQRSKDFALNAASILVLGGLWWAGSQIFPSAIPQMAETVDALVEIVTTEGPRGEPFYYHIWKTAEMIFISLSIAMVIGTISGVALGSSDVLGDATATSIYAFLSFPSLVVVFISGTVIGFNATASYLAVIAIILPFIVLDIWEGTQSLGEELYEMSRFFGASKFRTFKEITIPQLVPYLFASFRSGMSMGWKITLLAEVFLLTRGIGFMFKFYFDQYEITMMVGWLILFIAVLLGLEYGILVPLRNYVTRWQSETDAGEGILTSA